MLDPHQLTLHTLTMKQLATAEQLAEVSGEDPVEVEAGLDKAVAAGEVIERKGKYVISPAGRAALDAVYPEVFAAVRASDAVRDAMDAFEDGVNRQVLALTTDWQTREVGGEQVPNDHGDPGYDAAIMDKLAAVVGRAGKVLRPLVDADPLVERFLGRIDAALTRAEGGETDYVSGMRVDSVHTVWFQMYEHLLRLTGRERPA